MVRLRELQTGYQQENLRHALSGIAVYFQQYQKHFEENLNNVRIDVNQISQESESIKEIVRQIMSGPYYASSKEGDPMIEILNEVKAKTNQIDDVVRKLETDVAVIKNTIELKFDNLTATLNEIKTSISSISTPVTVLNTQVAEMKKDIGHITGKLDNSVTNKKWLITTILTGISVIGVIAKLIIG